MTPTADLARLTRRFQALSDETRLRIIDMLRSGERCVCELTEALDAGQSRLSFHLKVLKDAGLVVDRKVGTRRVYQVDPHAVADLRAYFDAFWDQSLAAYRLAAEQEEPSDG